MTITNEKLKAILEQQLAELNTELEQTQAQASDGMGHSTHQADHASTATDQAADYALRDNATRLKYEVEQALQRMADGWYGICQECKQPVDRARLEAVPYARHCINCADQHA